MTQYYKPESSEPLTSPSVWWDNRPSLSFKIRNLWRKIKIFQTHKINQSNFFCSFFNTKYLWLWIITNLLVSSKWLSMLTVFYIFYIKINVWSFSRNSCFIISTVGRELTKKVKSTITFTRRLIIVLTIHPDWPDYCKCNFILIIHSLASHLTSPRLQWDGSGSRD